MVWQPNILNNCIELSGGYAPPPNHPPGALPLDLAGGLPFPRLPVPPSPNPGYATGSKTRKHDAIRRDMPVKRTLKSRQKPAA